MACHVITIIPSYIIFIILVLFLESEMIILKKKDGQTNDENMYKEKENFNIFFDFKAKSFK